MLNNLFTVSHAQVSGLEKHFAVFRKYEKIHGLKYRNLSLTEIFIRYISFVWNFIYSVQFLSLTHQTINIEAKFCSIISVKLTITTLLYFNCNNHIWFLSQNAITLWVFYVQNITGPNLNLQGIYRFFNLLDIFLYLQTLNLEKITCGSGWIIIIL